jgi:hypothetical protein
VRQTPGIHLATLIARSNHKRPFGAPRPGLSSEIAKIEHTPNSQQNHPIMISMNENDQQND